MHSKLEGILVSNIWTLDISREVDIIKYKVKQVLGGIDPELKTVVREKSEICKGTKMLKIRRATIEDLDEITEIYNQAILKTTATFDTEPKTVEDQKAWFENHGPKYLLLVAEEDGKVLGWASLSRWSDRCAYSDTAEISLYVEEKQRGKGIGKQLLKTILEQGEKAGIHSVIARIVEGNEVSVHLHQSEGFEHIGIMKEVGRKFGRLLDVYMMQKIYRRSETPK